MSSPPHVRRLVAFFRTFVAHAPRGVAWSFGLGLSLAAMQGVGILLLVPLLSYVGVTDTGDDGCVGRIAALFFEDLGLPRNLPVILLVYVLLVTLRGWLQARKTVLDARLQLGFVRHLRTTVYRALLASEWRFFATRRRSDFVQTLTRDVDRLGSAAGLLMNVTGAIVLLGVYLAIAFQLSVPATLLTLASLWTLAWMVRYTLGRSSRAGRQLTTRSNRVYSLVLGHLDGIQEIRSYQAEARSSDSFDATVGELDAARLDHFRSQSEARFWMNAGGAVILALLVLVAVEVMALPTAALLVLVYVFARMVPQAGQLHGQALSLLHALPAYEAVQRLLDEAREAAPAPEPHEDGPQGGPLRLTDRIVFESVSFAYDEGRPAVEHLSFTLPARRTTAIVGPSGSGKSTTVMLLMGLLTPDRGRILVDGAPLLPGLRRGWQRRIGYVPQETFLLHDTLAENLRLARPEASEEEMWTALREASAEPFVRALPAGLETVLGDRGMRLSGGERQRVALARALLARPDILVLDEATSSLDAANEARIFDALDRLHGRVTVVLVTHRVSSLDHADGTVRLAEGRRVDEPPADRPSSGRPSRSGGADRSEAGERPAGGGEEQEGHHGRGEQHPERPSGGGA